MVEIKSRQIESESFESPIKFKGENFVKDLDFIRKFTTIKNKVQYLLKNNPDSRNNYFYLCLLFWGKTGQIDYNDNGDEIVLKLKKNKLNSITSPESITRPCRAIFEEAKKLNDPDLNFLLLDDEALEKKQEQEKAVHGYFGETKLKTYRK